MKLITIHYVYVPIRNPNRRNWWFMQLIAFDKLGETP